MADVDNWNADMDAWGLTGTARVHHLRRLHAYHRRIEALHWRRWERIDVIQGWICLALVVWLIVSLVVTW